MQGHNHGGKSHLLGMVGIAAVVLVVLLAAGRSFGEALPLAAILACPLMMIGMMFMMGKGHQHGGDSAQQGRDEPASDEHHHMSPDSPERIAAAFRLPPDIK